MLTPKEIELYSRHFLIEGFTHEHQDRLKRGSALVIGAGGLGTPVLLYLAGAGIGKLGIVEYDSVEISNMNRQFAYTRDDLGRPKTEIIEEKIKSVSSECVINLYNEKWAAARAESIAKEFNILIDCSDNYASRYLSDSISIKLQIPMIYGAVHQMEGQMAVFNYKGSRSYSELFPNTINQASTEAVGVLGPLAGIIGSLQATEALKILANFGTVLVNKLFVISLKHNRTQYIDF